MVVFKKPGPKKKKTKKYNSSSCKCKQGHIHLSRGEAAYCNEVELRRKAGEFHSFQCEKQFDLCIDGRKICSHKPDFAMFDKEGHLLFIEEYKGFPTAIWQLKRKLFQALYPEVPYIVIYHKGKK